MGFNLVIEYLLISTLLLGLGETLLRLCFNLVIEYLLISTAVSSSYRAPHLMFQSRNRVSSNFNSVGSSVSTLLSTSFNLVIEYLLISTGNYTPNTISAVCLVSIS